MVLPLPKADLAARGRYRLNWRLILAVAANMAIWWAVIRALLRAAAQ